MVEAVEALVEELAVAHRARAAYRRLTAAGRDALPAVLQGLKHEDANVRLFCTLAMDHLADSDSFPEIAGLLSDPSPRVRLHALHALACDRCKDDDVCLPPEETILQSAMSILRGDDDAHVRAMAVEVVGKWVHRDNRAVTALVEARSGDVSPAVRKKAGWYAPGGTIYRKTAPRKGSGVAPSTFRRDLEPVMPRGPQQTTEVPWWWRGGAGV